MEPLTSASLLQNAALIHSGLHGLRPISSMLWPCQKIFPHKPPPALAGRPEEVWGGSPQTRGKCHLLHKGDKVPITLAVTRASSVAREIPIAVLPTWLASAGKTFPSLPNCLSSHF